MVKRKDLTPKIQDLTGLLNSLYPAQYAEEWDNVGLQVGDPQAEVNRVLVCLDTSEPVLAAAHKLGAEAVVAHHPLIFKPLKSLTPTDETGQLVWRAARGGIAVLAAHTNLDRACPGLNDWLAERLGVEQPQPLQLGGGQELFKLVVFVPQGHAAEVADALFAAGAGQIGNYDRCSFRTAGIGTFRGGETTTPFLGTPGVEEQAEELRLETIVPREALNRCLTRLLKAHPYEEVAYDLIPLANRRSDIGLGRIGRLAEPLPLKDFSARVAERLGATALRWVGDGEQPVHKVALCGGSGASLLQEAVRQGADVLVTGDVKYHEARSAEAQGIGLVDAGHFATEQLAVTGLVAALENKARERGLKLEFFAMDGETEPFRLI